MWTARRQVIDRPFARRRRVAYPVGMVEPSEHDRQQAAIRAAIAKRQAAEYAESANLTLGTLGPGWTPWMKLVLLDSDHRHTGNTEPAAVAWKVYRGERRLSENSLYLRKLPDGAVKRADSYDDVFPELHEPHPTKKLEIRGELVPAPKVGTVLVEFGAVRA